MLKRTILAGLILLIIGCLIPQPMMIPVAGASAANWNAETFWYEPWGRSGVHKGIDIFADTGSDVIAPTGGLVIYSGELDRGGHSVLMLASKWRLHYLAHMQSRQVKRFDVVSQGDVVGTVGATGNAAGKPPHLHYSVVSMIPLPWRIDGQTQGWKKMFYLDPGSLLGS